MTVFKSLSKIALSTVLVAGLIALALAPFAGISGVAIARTNQTMQSELQDLTAGNIPGVTTVQDASGKDMAYVYRQRRHPVDGDEISDAMKNAIVSIEDERFYKHGGVDFQGNFRALWTNLTSGGVSQGASTIDQQYVKNYLLLVSAQNDEERAAAIEQSATRKLREMRMATQLNEELDKEEILTNYLNLVSFGNHAYGVEAAARTYFDSHAADLTVPQAAMLAGMVQSSERLNPYTNKEEVLDRRNVVLQSMVDNGYLEQADADKYKKQELGVNKQPNTLDNGCIGAGDRGFFCDFVLHYLEEKGIDQDQLTQGGYTIKTTLDPQVQDTALFAVQSHTHPNAQGVTEVMNVIEPSTSNRKVLAMVSSRAYGLDQDKNETLLPQTNSLVGNGAGSVFKTFTAAAAIEAGYGIKNTVDVPIRYEAEGLGFGGADNCPANRYCVENAGNYKPTMTLQEALAHSPNTPFIKLTEQIGVAPIVDMAVRLGLRSYDEKGTFDKDTSIAQRTKDASSGSFTLGPNPVNPLELSNVGATIASHGWWCEPNPIDKVLDKNGNEVYLKETPCEQAVDQDVAHALSNALSEDATQGTAKNAALAAGFSSPIAAKTGTTESNQSSAFLGFNEGLAAAPYIYNDGTDTQPLCTSPVRQCTGSGNLFGGLEPAQTFFTMASQLSRATQSGLPNYNKKYDDGTTGDKLLDSMRGKTESQARSALEAKGYVVKTSRVVDGSVPYGRVVRALTGKDGKKEGGEITLQLSDGSPVTSPVTQPPSNGVGSTNTTGTQNNTGSPGTTGVNNWGGNNGGGWNLIPEDFGIFQQDIDNLRNEIRNLLGR
ncbi:penicillin-binding protein [Corynebacterium macginleyi]|uniref:transglycosylase domain-containing protein n=1 Tax=Corynebacterium macginleyi TaxID=38290 RepID=UPI001909C9AC|nr:transglycosylase domain-containing protein [Corynebacterium macginleyi]MBK4147204.1 penicillin-binding protein [Corynebacterium macginleyi]